MQCKGNGHEDFVKQCIAEFALVHVNRSWYSSVIFRDFVFRIYIRLLDFN